MVRMVIDPTLIAEDFSVGGRAKQRVRVW